MNDYKELVEYLRKMHNVMLHNDNVESGVPEENITDVDAIACKEAADAIEQLVKERDAAVADINGTVCDACVKTGTKKCTGADGVAIFCNAFEWRGVRE